MVNLCSHCQKLEKTILTTNTVLRHQDLKKQRLHKLKFLRGENIPKMNWGEISKTFNDYWHAKRGVTTGNSRRHLHKGNMLYILSSNKCIDIYPPLQCHTEQFLCPKILCAPQMPGNSWSFYCLYKLCFFKNVTELESYST